MVSDEDFSALLEAAIAAPSADNDASWRLGRQGMQLRLRQPGLADMAETRRRLSLIALGCVAESIGIRASRLGYSAQLDGPANGDDGAVTISLQAASCSADPLDAVLLTRHSNRKLGYTGPAFDANELAQLSAAATVPGGWLQWLDSTDQRPAAVALIELAERQRFVNPALHQEMYSGVRFDVGWQASCTRGLPPGALGVHPLERLGFRCLSRWPLQRAANLLGTHRLMAIRSAALPARRAPNLCAIGSTSASDDAVFNAGRLGLRVWLQATALGRAAQVFAASPIYALPRATAIAPALQQQLAEGWQALCPAGVPMMIMRFGVATPPAIRSGRPPASSMVEPI